MAKTARKKHVLWVDDDLLFQRSYREELAELCKLDIAKSPEAMWKLLNENGPQFYAGIVLDVLLPYKGMDIETTKGGLRTGLTLLEMIKASKEFSSIPVILFSIRETADVDEIGEQHGVRVLRKSETHIEEFISAVKKDFGI
jgi:hypothetical protein